MLLSRKRERFRRRTARSAEHAATALDARLPVMAGARALLRKAFPDHWSFLLGELALYSFVILLVTGVYLTLFFKPSMAELVYHGSYQPLHGVRMSEAYASTLDISFDVRGGLLLRQIHHWAALLFVSAIGVHLLRIFFTGAFRRPREVNWVIGVTLFLLALLEGFAGYSLPDDLLSGTGLRTAEGIVLAIPLVGTYLQMFLFGGEFPGQDIVPRLYTVHILLVPGALLALITVHLILVVYLKHTQWAARGRTNRNVVGPPLFPHYTAKSVGLLLMVFGVLGVLAAIGQINPVWMYGPYRPDQASTDAQPDWYVGFLEGAIRLMPGVETRLWGHTLSWNPLLPAVVLPGVLFMVLYAYPFFERWLTGDRGEHHLCDRPRNRPVRTGLGAAAVTSYAVMLAAGGQDVIAYSFHLSVDFLVYVFRTLFFVLPVVAFWVTKRVCLGLQAHEEELLTEGEETGFVRQGVAGGFEQGRREVAAGRRYTALVRDVPAPLPVGEAAGRAGWLRALLSNWYYTDRVRLPAPPDERPAAAVVSNRPPERESSAD
ncbi:cytochrome bc complex cytochrome b subunit [Streptomyces sp. NPDC092296]|uniref:cytochrome bc1 complex cytochrome b subunit n=1 Tax=Streptomyces sp. NPDC092296 TaxID=3366012 RepID=UPI00382F0421